MKMLIALFTSVLIFTAGAANITTDEHMALHNEFNAFCKENKLTQALQVIDRFYTYDDTQNIPPANWYWNHYFQKVLEQRLSFSGLSPDQLLPVLAKELQTPQAKFELYHAAVHVLQRRLKDSEKPDKAKEPSDTAWRYYQIFLQDKSITPFVAYYALFIAARQYHHNLTPEKARKILDILSRKFGDAAPEQGLQYAMADLKIDALLELGRAAEALSLIEENRRMSLCGDIDIFQTMYLLRKGKAMLQLKNTNEAKNIIADLKNIIAKSENSKNEYKTTKMKINDFIQEAEKQLQ